MKRRGLQVIELDPLRDQTSAVVMWLRELERQLKVKQEPTAENNLPRIVRELIGRDQTVQEVSDSLAYHRLCALVGPPGIGKTSVALKVGQECARGDHPGAYEDVVWFTAREKPETQSWFNDVLNIIRLTRGYPRATRLSLEEKKKSVELLLDKPTVVILDSFESTDDSALKEC